MPCCMLYTGLISSAVKMPLTRVTGIIAETANLILDAVAVCLHIQGDSVADDRRCFNKPKAFFIHE